jgi:two-component system, OmpR family, alkaline phosphatase synthesis response regulator PhoP
MMPQAPPKSDRFPQSARTRCPLILVIEDTDDLRELFAAELATDGFLVIDAANGETGIEKARRFEPDGIVLDLMLPGINGFNVARILRGEERTRNTAIVAVTALRSQHHHAMAFDAGCDACLSKPVLGARVVAELMRLLVQRRPAGDISRLKKR